MGNPDYIETTVRFASMRQIHASIDHLHIGDFECAITLAGAGEGMLAPTDNPHFRQKVIALAARLPKAEEGGAGPIADSPNDYINWLKHGTIKPGGKRIEKAKIEETEVIATIWRAITKFEAVYGDLAADRTPQMLGFENWARAHLQNA
jgi:hypothetical protein